MRKKILVTGANGHIGNNLVRALLDNGEQVTAGVRTGADALAGLPCEVVRIDLLDPSSLARNLPGTDTLYQVGAVFRHWARDPETEIFAANIEGVRNVMEAAAAVNVRRIVFVSSLAALDRSAQPITEVTWNPRLGNVYARSKTEAEKLAWQLAAEYQLDMVSVLPGATVGGNCFRMTPTMNLLKMILDGRLSSNPGFHFNFVDVEDVVAGLLAAAVHGRSGERYLLANENCMSIEELVDIARQEFPERSIRTPSSPPRAILWLVAAMMELNGKLRGTEPELRRNYLSEFTIREQCDISKARRELGFQPKPPRTAVLEAMRYLAEVDGQAGGQ